MGKIPEMEKKKNSMGLDLGRLQSVEYEPVDGQTCIVEQKVDYINVLDKCTSEEKPHDIQKVHCVSNEGFLRKDIHFVVETELKIHVLSLILAKSGFQQSFEVEVHFEFDKSFAEIAVNEKIKSISLQNYADKENLIVILKSTGESKMMSESIMHMMIEYANSIKVIEEEEESSEDEEEKARIAAIEARRQQLFYRMTKVCRREEPIVSQKKPKAINAQNQTLSAIRNFFSSEVKANYFAVDRYFIRR
jgi:hypothetical protein